MTTHTELKLEQLPYGREAAAISDLLVLPGKLFAGLGKLFDTLSEAIAMRNRYLELDGLSDATLQTLGINRQEIPHLVVLEAGLITAVKTPVADNSNERTIRPAA